MQQIISAQINAEERELYSYTIDVWKLILELSSSILNRCAENTHEYSKLIQMANDKRG